MKDYSEILNQIFNALSGIRAEVGNVSSEVFFTHHRIGDIVSLLNATNILLGILTIVLSINTYINWKKYRDNK
ncbi:hypothetical protein Tmath_2101 [Thermoanaerobacter mathranii subsp. mathranii str. A3]|jgi:hypothetical protein|uniref:Uncharacterized protein n=1 Tax=Thermoanaerobacter mathranii subsp. mathranii (strain DSM 11426 / CCUG 53645 / CIP 108742 / A3) TaxID=583358 RepID=A0ABM5LT68_THEM3|nr:MULTISPECIES: hypothetical protein [Thermoanaerobacter]ADH61774.1 hypothetical protein Tmath_2101 [Thermoanaerobacter mathranii subsp. mathranii str. A3]MBT1278241.1 hypothetical protein [Thermoanaerobacter sp. CM-CNRG TB177]